MQQPNFLSPRAKPNGGGWLDICPAHNDTNCSLSITYGENGQWVFYCFAGCHHQDIRDAYSGNGFEVYTPVGSELRKPIATNQTDSASKLETIRRIMRESSSVYGTVGEQYLNSRGIICIPEAVRSHPSLWHSGHERNYQGLLLAVPSLGQHHAIHRTFLNASGVKIDRRKLGSCKGHGAYLLNLEGPVVVGEGLESTLSWWQLRGCPQCTLISALDAPSLGCLDLPDNPTRTLIIAPDNDDAGIRSAEKLRGVATQRGWRVELDSPSFGKDWNDVLMERNDDQW